ncbi:MAG: hypothetical protein ABFE13_17380 [Phycisphaerales bacterium]
MAIDRIGRVAQIRSRIVWFLSILACLSVLGAPAIAAITIDGVEDKEVYSNRVVFTVQPEAGFEYAAELNGASVAVGTPVQVAEPDYYELNVRRTDSLSGAEETTFIQFIVRATDRGNSEWGLPPWTPYPMIDSAAAEFAGGRLVIVVPAAYPMTLEIPVIARVEDQSGNRVGVNGVVTAAGFADRPLRLLRGVGSVFLPAAATPGAVSYTAQVHSLEVPKTIAIESTTVWQTVSGDIAVSTDWGQNARVRITEALRIVPDATLTIGSGSVVVVDPGVEISVEGRIVVQGTVENPVVFTCQDRNAPWGGLLFETSTSQGEFTGAVFTGSGDDPDWFGNNPGHGSSHRHEQPLLYVANKAHVTLTDCWMVNNQGQGGHGESGYITMTRCLVQKCISAGQYNGGSVTLEDCALIEFPSETAPFADDDNDGLYLTGGAHSLADCLIGWALDDGVDAGSGSGGSVDVRRCWFESTYHEAMAWSEPRIATVADTVALNCGQGIECGFGNPDVNAVHCLSTANLVGARFGDNYDWTYNGFLKVRDSLLLFNLRDIWGRAWDDWTIHLDQMDIRDSYVSAADADFPDNRIWNPQDDPNQANELTPFLPTPAETVGIGIAAMEDALDSASLAKGIPVRLSTFTTHEVSVDYTIDSGSQELASGTLRFTPGETVRRIDCPADESLCEIRVTLSNPVNSEITGLQTLTIRGLCKATTPLILEGDVWRYFKGTQPAPADWNSLAFDDSTWLSGPTPIGFESSSGYESRIATNLTDMHNGYLSVYARREFSIDDPSRVVALSFTMDYDDGYVAYLNGVEIATQSAPTSRAYDQPATASHEACCGTSTPTGPCPPESIDLSGHLADLVAGTNILAVQAHNQSLSSSDFIFIPELFVTVNPQP